MSRTLKKKKHWSSKVVECAVSWGNLGDFGSVVEVLGGAEVGQFPYLGQMKLDVLVCHVGKLPYYGDVLLEVNGTPVSGLTNRDTLAVIRHFREPIRLKTVKPGGFPPLPPPLPLDLLYFLPYHSLPLHLLSIFFLSTISSSFPSSYLHSPSSSY